MMLALGVTEIVNSGTGCLCEKKRVARSYPETINAPGMK